MSLTLIKPKTHDVHLAGKNYSLRYDLRAFAFMEEQLNSVSEAIELFNKKDTRAIAVIFQAGLLREDVDVCEISREVNLDNLLSTIATALSEAISQDYNFEEEIDWPLLYYIIKPAMNMSEAEFWSSTHRQMFGYLKTLERYREQSIQTQIAENQKQTVEAFMGW